MNPTSSNASGAVRRYRIVHNTAYDYSDQVSTSFGRGHLRPRDLDGQRCLDHQLVVDPAPSDMADSVDVFGNVDSYFHVTSSHTRLSVTGTSLVEVSRPVLDDAVLAQPWEGSRPVPRSEPAAIEFVLSSPMIDTPPAVLAYARESFTDGRAIGEAVLDLTHRIHRDFAYDAKATTISTRVADVLAVKAGVCQDFAHLSIACLRSVGLAGRYTSGYLATYPPPGRERIVGADASHAWASVRLSDGSWLAFDPTNDHLTDERYTTVAWGRDYGDVPPLRGIIFTDAQERTMKVSVDVAPV
jgi:transglutaminase-like putative cysteine protease